MATGPELEEIVRKVMTGDRAAFELLYGLLVDRIFAYVRSRTSSKTEAIDLTQDIFIELHGALLKFTYVSEPHFYSFVYTLTKRKLAKHYERARIEKGRVAELPNENLLPDSADSTVETYDAVARALATLPDVAREIVVLHHWSRYTFAEIATLLEMNESAVRVRHHRALKELAPLLGSLKTSA